MTRTAHRCLALLLALCLAVPLSGAAFAQTAPQENDPFMMHYRHKGGSQIFGNNAPLSTGGRLQVLDSPAAEAARAKAKQLAEERERAAAEAAEKAEQEKTAAQNPPPQKNTAIGDMPCLPLEDLLTVLVSERRLGYLADAIDHTGTVHMWFMSRERREWASLTVADDLTACITAQGASWNFALEPMKPAVGE